MTMTVQHGDSLDLLLDLKEKPSLIVTDPPYAFGGDAKAHAISATVAIVLRESAKRLQRGGWMVVMCASSWRSISYMVESVRKVVQPVRIGTWTKPKSRTKVSTKGWKWASVAVIAFRKGKARELEASSYLDHIEAPIVKDGRIAQLPPSVADWMVKPFAKAGDLMLDPFAGSGVICEAAERAGMRAIGFEGDVEAV
jgi:DNA modification methylase